MKSIAVVCLIVLAAAVAAQTPSFEVASVKTSNPNATGPLPGLGAMPIMLPQGGGRLSATNMTLRFLVQTAYGLQDYQIIGGPDWQKSNKYDITAKAPEGTSTLNQDHLLPMLKALLAERFRLKVHTETREMPVQALVVARGDGKLGRDITPSTSECASTSAENQKRAEAFAKGGIGALTAMLPKPGETMKCAMMPKIDPANPAAGFGFHADGQAISVVIALLNQVSDRPVIDKTGLTGLYDFDLRFDPMPLAAAAAAKLGINVPMPPPNAPSPFGDSPSLLTALQEQLGLKLDSQRGPVEVLVIDSAELPDLD